MQVELLTRVRLDPKQAILCQCKGCKRRVHADVHVLKLDGELTVFGGTCFKNLFGDQQYEEKFPWNGESQLTPDQRSLLEQNTKEFIERYLIAKQEPLILDITIPTQKKTFKHQPFTHPL